MTSRASVAAVASFGAGAIHAAAVGAHAEHRQAVIVFTVIAVLQLCWGGVALARPTRRVALAGAALNAGLIAGWAIAKSSGISFVDGLEIAEPVQTADALAAGLALVAVAAALWSLRTRRSVAVSVADAVSTSGGRLMSGACLAAVGVAVLGMVSAGTHVHAHGAGTADAAHAHDDANLAGGDHAHDDAAAPVHDDTAHAAPIGGADHAAAAHLAAAPVPYDPTKPIDLGGVEGVTPEQQAAAENLVAITLVRLPQWSDPAVAEAAGFRSIGDGVTGVEHFVNQTFMDDDVILDPDQPESLVYDTTGGGRRLVAAMYMVARGTPLEDVPDVGGALMQWHTHENLCYSSAGKVAGITDANGDCPPGLTKPVPTPMIHVWIEPHRCGPFAALEGIGGGTIAEGETVLCDHAHGS
ncbi:MAG: hypothetical protein AB7Q42_02060 [Acidimicrobiia bacterium]